MVFIGEHEQKGVLTTGDIRSIFNELLSFDFHIVIDGFFGNYWGISRCLTLCIFFFGLLGVLSQQIPNLPLFAFEWLLGTAPIWVSAAQLPPAWKGWASNGH